MPVSGSFACQPATAEKLLYYVNRPVNASDQPQRHLKYGLYESSDSGQSWRLIYQGHGMRDLLQLTNGLLFCMQFEPTGPGRNLPSDSSASNWRMRLMKSGDEGRKWQDITGDLEGGIEVIEGLTPDPDHSDRVCVLATSRRSYVIQAADNSFQHWEWIRETEWDATHMTDRSFFKVCHTGANFIRGHQATLRNYFADGFNGSTYQMAVRILTSQTEYRFNLREPKPVPVEFQFLPENQTLKILDLTNGPEFWRLRVITPDGRRDYGLGRTNMGLGGWARSYTDEKGIVRTESYETDPEEVWRKYSGRTDFRTITLKKNNPYRREVDLSQIYQFNQPGRYRFQLIYDSGDWFRSNRKLDRDLWGGSTPTKSFAVVIER
jgi:hypothetical protein